MLHLVLLTLRHGWFSWVFHVAHGTSGVLAEQAYYSYTRYQGSEGNAIDDRLVN